MKHLNINQLQYKNLLTVRGGAVFKKVIYENENDPRTVKHWIYSFQFPVNTGTLLIYDWVEVKETNSVDICNNKMLGVFAKREFHKDQCIGLYIGMDYNSRNKNNSQYTIHCCFGHIDPKKHSYNNNDLNINGMAMHMIRRVDNKKKDCVNVMVDEFLLIKGVKKIAIGDELYIAEENITQIDNRV